MEKTLCGRAKSAERYVKSAERDKTLIFERKKGQKVGFWRGGIFCIFVKSNETTLFLSQIFFSLQMAHHNASPHPKNAPALSSTEGTAPFTLLWKGKNVFPGINKTKTICGGKACIGMTRIPVWLVIAMLQEGKTLEAILDAYPSLSVGDIAGAQYYYLFNKAEIDEEIRSDV